MKLIIDDEEIIEIPILKVPQLPVEVIVPPPLGRKEGSANKSQLEKEIIAIDATVNAGILSQKEIAAIHGVTETEVNNHSKGVDKSNLDGQTVNKDLKSLINQTKYQIADKATAKLMTSLDLFNPGLLKQKDIPAAARNMAVIVEKVTQGFQGDAAPSVNFQIYAPRITNESSFNVIEVDE